MNALRLGVNIDHVATIRNARGGAHPDPARAAQAAKAAGARWSGVTPTGLGWLVEVGEWPAAEAGALSPLHVVATVRAAGGEGAVLARLATLRLPPATRAAPAERELPRRGR